MQVRIYAENHFIGTRQSALALSASWLTIKNKQF